MKDTWWRCRCKLTFVGYDFTSGYSFSTKGIVFFVFNFRLLSEIHFLSRNPISFEQMGIRDVFV